MIALVIIASSIGVIGTGFAVWSIINTRKRYYDDYMRRKRKPEQVIDLHIDGITICRILKESGKMKRQGRQ